MVTEANQVKGGGSWKPDSGCGWVQGGRRVSPKTGTDEAGGEGVRLQLITEL